MLKFRAKPASDDQGAPLTLRAADGALQRTFDPEIVNSFRHMATELTCNGELPKRIALVSALRGEGVTYTALALGTTLASDMATRVCVVELNWWAPGMLKQLDPATVAAGASRRRGRKLALTSASGLLDRPGLAQVLTDDASLTDVLIPSSLPNLDLLPAGELPMARRPAMARSAALRALIDELSARYDHLLLDVPAVLLTSDAIALASLSEACAVVVRQGITPSSQVQQALDDLKHLTMLGVVLNQVSIKTPRWLRALIPQA